MQLSRDLNYLSYLGIRIFHDLAFKIELHRGPLAGIGLRGDDPLPGLGCLGGSEDSQLSWHQKAESADRMTDPCDVGHDGHPFPT